MKIVENSRQGNSRHTSAVCWLPSMDISLFLHIFWGSSMNIGDMKSIYCFTIVQWGSRVGRTSYVIGLHSREYWDLPPPLWKSLQFIPGWCKSTYILVSIQYSWSTWCHHRSCEALGYRSGHSTWLCGLAWLLPVSVKPLTISERIHHILVRKDHGKNIHTRCGCYS